VDDRDSVLALLPTDHAGVVDWVAAVRQGVIRPRIEPPGMTTEYAGISGHDFYFQGPPETFFPHSTHSYWLTCGSCHPRIYRYRGESDMASCKEGCHDTVAFTIAACERCHADLNMKPGRIPASLGEPLVLGRDDRPTAPQTVKEVPGAAEAADSVDLEAAQFEGRGASYTQARFEHWVHRVRYRCTACHVDRFALETGETPWTGTEAHGEELCGGCHNGAAAFDIGVNECHLCHYEEGDAEGGDP
jgi:c(7)-type cytochrome triheme protein